jgi:succinate dehydrogenase / fumarate reductase, membrane anchor subunit
MNTTKSMPKSGESSNAWLIKILSGILIIIILGVHFVVNHTLGSRGGLLTYEGIVLYYAKNPIIPIMEILFVTFVVTHALLGLRGIILDLKPSAKTLKTVNWVFWVVGVGFVLYGIGLIAVIVYRGMQI